MPIQIGGIISGVNTDDVIAKLLEIDARRKQKLEDQKKGVENVKDLVGNFNSKLLDLKVESDSLLLTSAFQKRSTTSTDTTAVTATAADGATAGTYNIIVDTLATNSVRKTTDAGIVANQINERLSRVSTGQVVGGSGTLTLTSTHATAGYDIVPDGTINITTDVGTDTFDLAAMATDTPQELIDAVNASAALAGSVTMAYDSATDKFSIRRNSFAAGTTLTLVETPVASQGFFTATGLRDASRGAGVTTSEQGVNVDISLGSASSNVETLLAASGTLTVNGTAITYSATETMSSIISKLNSNSGSTGVTAAYDSTLDRVVLTSTAEGPQSIALSETGGNLISVLELGTNTNVTKGKQAIFSINGDKITSDSNTYTFNGVTLTLKKTGNEDGSPGGADPAATITVNQDVSSVATGVKSFVTKYNDFVDFIKENASFDPETLQAGPLFGDSLVNTVDQRLKKLLLQPQPALVDTTEILAQIGITLGKLNTSDQGKMVVDDAKLNAAISSNPQAVEALFGRIASGTTKNAGIAYDISTFVNSLTKSKGLIDVKEDGLNERLDDLDGTIQREDDRLKRLEASLRRQFNSMETSLSILNAQGASINQQLSRL